MRCFEGHCCHFRRREDSRVVSWVWGEHHRRERKELDYINSNNEEAGERLTPGNTSSSDDERDHYTVDFGA